MFGYASDETDELMPLPIMLAHQLARELAERRKSGELDWLRPDGKTQVTVEYEDDEPVRGRHRRRLARSTPTTCSTTQIREAIIERVIETTIPKKLIDKNIKYHINPTGRFVIGGPQGDAGLTGRKIIVDTYGGMGRHGGGAFSGKDPTKVDRSACYAARWVAKNIVAAGLARAARCRSPTPSACAEPVSGTVDTFGTGKVPRGDPRGRPRELRHAPQRASSRSSTCSSRSTRNRRVRPFRPHAGEEPDGRRSTGTLFTWERTDRASALRRAAQGVSNARRRPSPSGGGRPVQEGSYDRSHRRPPRLSTASTNLVRRRAPGARRLRGCCPSGSGNPRRSRS